MKTLELRGTDGWPTYYVVDRKTGEKKLDETWVKSLTVNPMQILWLEDHEDGTVVKLTGGNVIFLPDQARSRISQLLDEALK